MKRAPKKRKALLLNLSEPQYQALCDLQGLRAVNAQCVDIDGYSLKSLAEPDAVAVKVYGTLQRRGLVEFVGGVWALTYPGETAVAAYSAFDAAGLVREVA